MTNTVNYLKKCSYSCAQLHDNVQSLLPPVITLAGCLKCQLTIQALSHQLAAVINLSSYQRAQQLEMQPLTNTLSNNRLIDRPLSSHSPGLRRMDLGVSVTPAGQTPPYLPPYSHFLQRCLRSNVKVNELARLCYRMCSLGHLLLLVCHYNLISPTLHHTYTSLPSPPNPSPQLTPLWFPGGLGSFARLQV